MPDVISLNTQNPPAPAPAPAPTPAPVEETVEGSTLVGSERMAPISAVIAERRSRQEVQKERDTLKAEIEQLRTKAQNYDIVEPYLPLLASHPKVSGKPAAPAPTNQPDPELLQIAKTFNFVDQTTGEFDLERAEAARSYMDQRTGARVKEAIEPVASQAAAVQARSLRERAYTVVDKGGRPFASREHIDHVLDRLPIDQQASPEIVSSALMIARGMGVAPAGEPLHTEGGGRPPSGTVGLSPVERAAARARGMSDADWIKARDADDNVLE